MKPLSRPDVKKLKQLHRYNGRIGGRALRAVDFGDGVMESIISPLIRRSPAVHYFRHPERKSIAPEAQLQR